MLRTHTCGALRQADVDQSTTLAGWIHAIRDKGKIIWIDLRDRYGRTQLVLEEGITPDKLFQQVRALGREYVIQATGKVVARSAPNPHLPTGGIEVQVTQLQVLNTALLPPFLIEDDTDGGEELRMRHRYLDLRRPVLQHNLQLRHQLLHCCRNYLDKQHFLEIETPTLIKSTPEGARDFIVPARQQPGHFYALPQSPQTLKQLLMVSGMDRYYQVAKCFRDEDLRADRQPEFTQLDCELSFVEQEDVLQLFEGLLQQVLQELKGVTLPAFPRMTYAEAMAQYGTDKPDLRLGMPFVELTDLVKGQGFPVFDAAALVVGVVVKGAAQWSRKQLDVLTQYVREHTPAQGLVYVKYGDEVKSSVDKFFTAEQLTTWAERANAQRGDALLVLAGEVAPTREALGQLRLEIGKALPESEQAPAFAALWVTDFPLLEWEEETQRYHAMHHPFTSPKPEDDALLETDPGAVRANAYDLVLNGQEIGGGSIRIHDPALQERMFRTLGIVPEVAQEQFGFLLHALQHGAPPHGGIALGIDRICAVLAGTSSIRDVIAFPKNNAGKDTMLQAPGTLAEEASQLAEVGLKRR